MEDMGFLLMSSVKKGVFMKLSYNKLWKLLIDKKMKRQDLRAITKISDATMAKLTKGLNVNTEVLVRICEALHCDISDIMEIEK